MRNQFYYTAYPEKREWFLFSTRYPFRCIIRIEKSLRSEHTQFKPLIARGGKIGYFTFSIDRQVPRKPRLVGGVERPNGSRGTMKNEISFPGSPAHWAGSFT
jgi:hypothetical protein